MNIWLTIFSAILSALLAFNLLCLITRKVRDVIDLVLYVHYAEERQKRFKNQD